VEASGPAEIRASRPDGRLDDGSHCARTATRRHGRRWREDVRELGDQFYALRLIDDFLSACVNQNPGEFFKD